MNYPCTNDSLHRIAQGTTSMTFQSFLKISKDSVFSFWAHRIAPCLFWILNFRIQIVSKHSVNCPCVLESISKLKRYFGIFFIIDVFLKLIQMSSYFQFHNRVSDTLQHKTKLEIELLKCRVVCLHC